MALQEKVFRLEMYAALVYLVGLELNLCQLVQLNGYDRRYTALYELDVGIGLPGFFSFGSQYSFGLTDFQYTDICRVSQYPVDGRWLPDVTFYLDASGLCRRQDTILSQLMRDCADAHILIDKHTEDGKAHGSLFFIDGIACFFFVFPIPTIWRSARSHRQALLQPGLPV